MRLRLVGSSVFACALVACQLIVGVEDEKGLPSPLGGDAGPNPDSGACSSVQPPAKRAGQVGPNSAEYTFAVHEVRAASNPQAPLGYDLDNRCTVANGPDPSCLPAVADAKGGIDNALAVLSAEKAKTDGDADPLGRTATANIANGVFTTLITLRNYNGRENDDSVEVALRLATGFVSNSCGDTSGKPAWNGCDEWQYDPETGSAAGAGDGFVEAYVADGTLVVRPERVLRLGLASKIPCAIDGAVFTAHIERSAGAVVGLSEGILAGGATPRDILTSTVPCDLVNRGDLDKLCNARDLPAGTRTVGGPCAAVSLALGFSAGIARVGPVVEKSAAACSRREVLDLTCQ